MIMKFMKISGRSCTSLLTCQDAVKSKVEVVSVSSSQKRASNIVKATSSGVVSGDQFRVPHQQSVILSYSKQGEYICLLLCHSLVTKGRCQ